MTTLVMMTILFFGIAAYRLLPVSDLPSVEYPTINVQASLPGASPDTMAASVATPLEKEFSTISGLESMTSSSSTGYTGITLQFDLSRDVDAAAQDVQSMIAQAARRLPRNLPAPPSYFKVNPANAPILFLNFGSQTLRAFDLNEYAETTAQRISMVPGVAQVSVRGSQKFAVRAQLDPRALAARQVGIDEVVSAMQSGNSNLPTGTLWGRHEAITVESNGQLTNAEQFGSVVIAYRNGAPVRLRDLGRVLDSVEDERNINWSQTGRSMTLAIDRQPGSNTVAVIENIKKILPEVEERLPPAVNMNIRYDRSDSILDSVNDVKFTLLLALVLVILVIFLFLRNASATAIPSTALPLSLVGTFAVMYLLHYSLDNLSLMALTLAVGFVVDDAIVMLENIVRHMEHGEAPMEAALRGSSEIGFTILSMTISLAAVFVPVLFLGGIVGRLLHEFAVTITTAILVSGFVSLSLTPMLCSRFLRSPHDQKHGAFYSFFESLFDGLLNIYSWSLRLVMRHRLVTMALSLILLVATGWMFVQVPKGFLPSEETGLINGFTETVQGTSFDSMIEHQRRLDKILKNNPYIEDYLSGTGGDRGGSNAGMLFLKLVPRKKRPSADRIIEELRPQFNQLTGIRVFLTNPPAIRIGSRASKSEYQFTLQSPDLKSLYASAPKLEARLRQMPGLQDISTDLQIKNPQVRVDIDRDKASTLGVTAEQIEDSLYSAFGARQVSTIFASTNSYSVMVELLPEFQRDPNALSMLYIRSNTGKLVPLSEVSHISRTVGPLSVNHSGQMPSVTVSFNLTPGYPLGNAVNDVNKAARQTLPSTISTGFQGSAQAFDSSLSGLGLLLVMAILVIYVVLGILYESFIHPITILSGLPSAGFGALVTLQLFHLDLNLYAFVGIIMLVGIVKKNAIMMIDFALEAQRNSGKTAAEAIYNGALVRFRPIMMTTMAALMGTLPIALGYGAGGETRRALGLAVVGGLVFSQLLTLFITPVYYVYLEKAQNWTATHLRFRKSRKKSAAFHAEPALAEHHD